MHVGEVMTADVANGEGMRVSVFVSGCRNHCKGCFQPQTWDFDYGEPFTKAVEDKIIESLKPYYINGLTLLGGEPFEPANQRVLVKFLHRVREECPDKDIWCFTGFVLDSELMCDGSYPRTDVTDEMLSLIDVLVDGRFVASRKDISLRFRGSSNQRLIDMNKTRACGKITLWDE